jgi:hypothetical protein
MTYQQLIAIKDEDAFLENIEISEVLGYACIDDKIALPITTSFSFDRNNTIDIKYESGTNIGEIKFLKDRKVEDIEGLPNDEKICFYIDYDQEYIVDQSHTFKFDYIILRKRYFNKYKSSYKKTSSIWGSFFHIDDKPNIIFDKKKTTNSLSVSSNLKIRNSIYKDNLFLSINEPNPFNRFLKLYHLLELQFDMHTAQKIKALVEEGNKEKEISGKLKEYTREEINRLISIIRERCIDLVSLTNTMNTIEPFKEKAIKIFYQYGKESNPLRRTNDFRAIIDEEGKFGNQAFVESQGHNYNIIIPKICAYWIYRVRSSIAHNKFGEYIMDKNDEEFIVEFAEPLLKEVVTQCFKI